MAEFDVRYLDAKRQPAQARVRAADAGGVAAVLGLSPAALLAVEPVAGKALPMRKLRCRRCASTRVGCCR